MDRLITLNLGNFDRETEIQVGMAKSGVSRGDAEVIVDIVRELRGTGVNNHRPTIRATIAIARILAHRQAHARLDDPVFQWVDVYKRQILWRHLSGRYSVPVRKTSHLVT